MKENEELTTSMVIMLILAGLIFIFMTFGVTYAIWELTLSKLFSYLEFIGLIEAIAIGILTSELSEYKGNK